MSSVTLNSPSTTSPSSPKREEKPPFSEIKIRSFNDTSSSTHLITETANQIFQKGTQELLDIPDPSIPSSYPSLEKTLNSLNTRLPSFSPTELDALNRIIADYHVPLLQLNGYVSFLDLLALEIYLQIKELTKHSDASFLKDIENILVSFAQTFSNLHFEIVKEAYLKNPQKSADPIRKNQIQKGNLHAGKLEILKNTLAAIKILCKKLNENHVTTANIDVIIGIFEKLLNIKKNSCILLTYCPFQGTFARSTTNMNKKLTSSCFQINKETRTALIGESPYDLYLEMIDFHISGLDKELYNQYFVSLFQKLKTIMIGIQNNTTPPDDLNAYLDGELTEKSDAIFARMQSLTLTKNLTPETDVRVGISRYFILKLTTSAIALNPKNINKNALNIRLLKSVSNFYLYYESIKNGKGIRGKFSDLFKILLNGDKGVQIFFTICNNLRTILTTDETLNREVSIRKQTDSFKTPCNTDKVISLLSYLHKEYSDKVTDIFSKNPSDPNAIESIKNIKKSFLENSRHVITLLLIINDIQKLQARDFSDDADPSDLISDRVFAYLDPDVNSSEATNVVELPYILEEIDDFSILSFPPSTSSSTSTYNSSSSSRPLSSSMQISSPSFIDASTSSSTPLSTSSSSVSSSAPSSSSTRKAHKKNQWKTSISIPSTSSSSSPLSSNVQISSPSFIDVSTSSSTSLSTSSSSISSSAPSSSSTKHFPTKTDKKNKSKTDISTSSPTLSEQTTTPSTAMIPLKTRDEQIAEFQLRKQTMKIWKLRRWLKNEGSIMDSTANGSGHKNVVDTEKKKITSVPVHNGTTFKTKTHRRILKAAKK